MQNEPKQKEEAKAKVLTVIIPQCCREGWDSCPHSVKRGKPKKSNIGV